MHTLAGLRRELDFRQNRDAAVLVLECEDIAEAREVLGTLPLVREGLIAFELVPLVPTPASPGCLPRTASARRLQPGAGGP